MTLQSGIAKCYKVIHYHCLVISFIAYTIPDKGMSLTCTIRSFKYEYNIAYSYELAFIHPLIISHSSANCGITHHLSNTIQ